MDLEERVRRLERQNRRLTVLVGVLIVLLSAVSIVAASAALFEEPLECLDCYRVALDRLMVTIEVLPNNESVFPNVVVRSRRGQILVAGRLDHVLWVCLGGRFESR